MARILPQTGYYYHVYNRGVDKRIIFENNADYARFIHSLYFCNDAETQLRNIQRASNVQSLTLHMEKRDIKRSENRLVDISCFSLMTNHFHLLVKQKIDNGLPLFMQRLGTAYTNFFNLKYERSGSLFQGSYKLKEIGNEQYLAYLSKYIHLNPLEIIEPDWQASGIKDWKKANEFLENYKWSSYPDYIGIKNFPSVLNKDILGRYHPSHEGYKSFINSFLVNELDQIRHVI